MSIGSTVALSMDDPRNGLPGLQSLRFARTECQHEIADEVQGVRAIRVLEHISESTVETQRQAGNAAWQERSLDWIRNRHRLLTVCEDDHGTQESNT